MEYLNSKESDEEFDDLSHIRGYLLNEFDENGNERNPSPEEETKKEQNGKDKILN